LRAQYITAVSDLAKWGTVGALTKITAFGGKVVAGWWQKMWNYVHSEGRNGKLLPTA